MGLVFRPGQAVVKQRVWTPTHKWRLLQVRAGICAAQLQDMDAALEHFHALFAVDAVDFADLYLTVGDVLSEQRHFDKVRMREHCQPHSLCAHLCLV